MSGYLQKPGSVGTTTTINGLSGDVTLSAGNNITLGETGNDIQINANFTQQGKYMISGGATWSGTGLVYDVSFLNYFFDGLKTANQSQVTLDASDPSNNRIDAIVVDEAGIVSVITGDAAASPVEPPIPEDQLQVQFILVEAGSVTPTITSEEIYMDDPTTNWTFSTYTTGAATGSINFAGTNSPKQGVNDIEADTDLRLGARFVRSTSFDAYQYTMLQVWVRFTGTAVASNKSLNVRFENSAGTLVGSTVNLFNYGLQRGVLTTWQLVVVPITAFGALPATVKGLKMIMGGGTVGQVRQWDIDYMILTNGSVPYANVPTIAFYKNGVGIASQTGLNLIEGTGVTINAVNDPTNGRVNYTLTASGQSITNGAPTQATRASVGLQVLDTAYSKIRGLQVKFGTIPNQQIVQFFDLYAGDPVPTAPIIPIDTRNLYSYAVDSLTGPGPIVDGDTVTIGGKTYTWQATLTNVNGHVQLGANDDESLQNVLDALQLTGTPGTQYAAAMTANTYVSGQSAGGGSLNIQALVPGIVGNTVPVSQSIASGNYLWNTPTLDGGHDPAPEDIAYRLDRFINAHTTVSGIAGYNIIADSKVLASSYVGDTVTVYSLRPGTYGNGIAVVSTDNTAINPSSSTTAGGLNNGTTGPIGSLRKGVVIIKYQGYTIYNDCIFEAVDNNAWAIISSSSPASNAYDWTVI